MRYLALLLLMLVAGCSEAHPRDAALRLEMERGVCSGTAVGKDLILSAEHCIADNRLLRVNGQPAYALEMVKDGKDHVLIRVTMAFTSWAKVKPGAAQGDAVTWWGNPAGEASVYREGYVSRARTDEVWIDAHGFGGDSGSGLLNARGEVVEVLSGIRTWRDFSGNSFSMIVAFPLAFSAEQWREIRA